jgi:delta14-sterol reductase
MQFPAVFSTPQAVNAGLALAAVYGLTYVLSAAIPGTPTPGYTLEPDGKRSVYNLNGLRVLVVTLGTYVAAAQRGYIPASIFAEEWPSVAAAAFCIGITVSISFYVRGRGLLSQGKIDRRARCPTVDSVKTAAPSKKADMGEVAAAPPSTPRSRAKSPSSRTAKTPTASSSASSSSSSSSSDETREFDSRSALEHFYCGLSEYNPKGFGGVDVKMWLYVVGAVQFNVNVLSALAAHASARAAQGVTEGIALPAFLAQFVLGPAASSSAGVAPTVGYAIAAYAFCVTFFIVEYLWNEEVHTYTYDIFRERIGFKLLWGCLFFYPIFYAVGSLPLFGAPASDATPATALLCVAAFFAGWCLTRGANMQKFACKQGRKDFFFGLVAMETVPGSNGRLLCSGFWGVSRHVNYLGEILQAVGLALPGYLATGSLVPWLYPLYYVALFIPRQIDDDAMCAAKYGAVWGEYVQRVPYRIVPYVY